MSGVAKFDGESGAALNAAPITLSDDRVLTLHGDYVREIVVDGCHFNMYGLLALARSAGEIFVAERYRETVIVRTIGIVDVGGGYGRLVVQRRDYGESGSETDRSTKTAPDGS